jgi:CubicO group peptidase (beta-lactamase class C family)
MRNAGQWRRMAILLAALAGPIGIPHARADESTTVQAIVGAFAEGMIHRGVAIGVGVGVIDARSGFAQTYTFGRADAVSGDPFRADTIFAIGSNTKVFTTNLLGQAVFENRLRLENTLSQFQRAFGMFVDPLTSLVSLGELGDFTAGFPTYAPICKDGEPPQTTGCRPSQRPSRGEYTAHDFLTYFHNFIEKTGLPAPYDYSDYSTGLLGLFLGTTGDQPIKDSSLDGWYAAVDRRILTPLGMTSTFLEVPSAYADRRAKGYDLPIAVAEVGSQGAITSIDLKGGGDGYSDLAPPAVRIVGGGGSGAMATATVKNGRVTGVMVKTGGSGYVDPPQIVFNQGKSTKTAHALPIISGGAVTGVLVSFEGAGYQDTPVVTIKGGGGSGATATAHIANEKVIAVVVAPGDGGSGYPDPLTVTFDAGAPSPAPAVPIWGAAGALNSTLDDLIRFAAAALTAGPTPPTVPMSVTGGFAIAEAPHACAAEDPNLQTCPPTTDRSGLAWGIIPADVSNKVKVKVPEVVVKNGGLGGYSSEIFLIPKRQLAVVVLVNSRSPAEAPFTELAFRPAPTLAANIGYNLLFAAP